MNKTIVEKIAANLNKNVLKRDGVHQVNEAVLDHIDQLVNAISPPLRTYKITIKQNGGVSEWIAKGETLNDAENSVQAYAGGNIYFLSGKDITDEK